VIVYSRRKLAVFRIFDGHRIVAARKDCGIPGISPYNYRPMAVSCDRLRRSGINALFKEP